MPGFYTQLKDAVLAQGVTRRTWAKFVVALRANTAGGRCWNGVATGGRMVLRAWSRDRRVPADRVKKLAVPLVQRLNTNGPNYFRTNLAALQCCRAFESACGAPVVRPPRKTRFATVRKVSELCRFYFDLDDGVASEDDFITLGKLFRKTNAFEQQKLLALFRRPLGRRTRVPEPCQSPPVPYPEAFDLVWAARERNIRKYTDVDGLRDALGLVDFYTGDEVVRFTYELPETASTFLPTVAEAMGGWAFWPGEPGSAQRRMNYRTGEPGAREFVHFAEVPPASMQYRWCGKLTRNWDD